MRPVKSFEEFRSELIESRKLDEGIMHTIKNVLKKVGEFFVGKGSKFLNGLILQEQGKLPSCWKLYPNKADMAVLKQNSLDADIPAIPESEKFVLTDEMNEAVISLMHPGAVQNVGTEELMDKLHAQLMANKTGKKPRPLLIWGAPGIGKTALIEMVAKEYGFNELNQRLIFLDLANMSREDFFLPTMEKNPEGRETGKSTRAPLTAMPLYEMKDGAEGDAACNGVDGEGGIIFLDEVARCDSDIQKVLMKLCDSSRRIDNLVLGSKWCIVCAANRQGDENDPDGKFHWNTTLGDRFNAVNFVPKFSEWAGWAETAKDEDGEPVVDAEILTFLKFYASENSNLSRNASSTPVWHNIDPDLTDRIGNPETKFATPRGWTEASKNVKIDKAAAKARGKEYGLKELESSVAAAIGTYTAKTFIAFVQVIKEVSPEQIKAVYNNPEKGPDMKKLDQAKQYGVIGAICIPTIGVDMTHDQLMNFAKWIIWSCDEQMAIRCLSMFKSVHPEYDEQKSRKQYGGDNNIPKEVLKKIDVWNEELMNMLYDAFPGLEEDEQMS